MVPTARPSALVRLFARNLRGARSRAGLSQEALADGAGLHRTYVSSVERAERNISILNIERLAAALKKEPWELSRHSRIAREIPSCSVHPKAKTR